MMKKIAILFGVGLLAACSKGPAPVLEEEKENRSGYETICLDGVQYWHVRRTGGYEGLAERIDPETLEAKRC